MADPARQIRTLFTREFLALIRNARARAMQQLIPMMKVRQLDIGELVRIIGLLNTAYIEQPAERLIKENVIRSFTSGIQHTITDLEEKQPPSKPMEEPLVISINFDRSDERAIQNLSNISLSDLKGFTAEMNKKIVRDFVEAEKQGSSVSKFSAIIQEHYNGIGAGRAEMIARTASMQAYNEAAWARTKEYAPFKEWLPTLHSERTRPSYLAMEGVIIPVEDAFKVPGFRASKNTWVEACEMMYPLDSSLGAPAGQIIQCRCSVGGRWTQKGKKK